MSLARTAASLPSVNLSFKNRVINGKMTIAQRGTSFAAIGSSAYSVDRWIYTNTGAAVQTATQQGDAPSGDEFINSLRFAVTTADASIAAGDVATIDQRVEGYNVRDLVGRPVTLSFWARSSKTGVHCAALRNSVADRSYVLEYTVNAANTWERKFVTVPAGLITAGTWNWADGIGLILSFVLAAGTTYRTTAGAWQTGNFVATANQVNCLDTIGNIFAITGVQLEAGSVPTAFDHRPHSQELAMCQRYYQTMWDSVNNSCNIQGYMSAGSNHVTTWLFPTQMRATPVVTKVGSWSGTNTAGQPVISTPSKYGFVFYATATALGAVQWNNPVAASQYITADAEI